MEISIVSYFWYMWIETNARIFSASSLSVMFLLDKMFFLVSPWAMAMGKIAIWAFMMGAFCLQRVGGREDLGC